MDTLIYISIAVLWCFTIPWSIFGVRWRNQKIDRSNASVLKLVKGG
jgi:hypothetical protein